MGSSCSADRRDIIEEEYCRPRISRSIKRKSKKKKRTKKIDHERRKHLLEALSVDAQMSELLSRMPGRISNNGSTSSACAFTQQGKKGTNQDALVVWEHYASRKDTLLCAVFDGHGPYGHLVARRVRDTLPSKLMGMWKARMRGESDIEEEDDNDEDEEEEECVRNDSTGVHNIQRHEVDANPFHDPWEQKEKQSTAGLAMATWKECIVKMFRQMDRELRIQPTIDCFCSGTTTVILLQQGQELIIGNVGDSRAVLATFTSLDASSGVKSQALQPVQLTIDLKPSLPREAERIRRCKGRVFAMQDEPDVARVWLPYDDAPGLAMARAFGDFCLKDYGLISEPDITYWTLSPQDQFVILATDGIWDVMSNSQALEVVASAPSRVTAARLLVETAVRAWRLKYPTSKVDDCAVICLFFHREATTTTRPCMRRTRPTKTAYSSYYYTGEPEDNEDDDDDQDAEDKGASTPSRRRKPVLAPAPTPETPSPSPDIAEYSNEKQQSATAESLQAFESEEISWGRSKPFHCSIRTDQHTEYLPEDSLHHLSTAEVDVDKATSPAGPAALEIEELLPAMSSIVGESSPPRRSLAEYLTNDGDDEEWSALEGVVRVNSILNLPRFKVGDSPSLRNTA